MTQAFEVGCLDCRQPYQAYDLKQILSQVCSQCLLLRGVGDYLDWCGHLGTHPDAEAAEEYLSTTDYGASLPEWIQARIRRIAP